MIATRLPPQQLTELDTWIAQQPDPKPVRSEALRRLAQLGIKLQKEREAQAKKT